MAFLEELQFTGSLGDLSFYRMRGSDKIVVRRKGGASKEVIKKSPNFALPRLYMSEFGGCSTMGKEVRFMMHPLRALADYNFSGFINKSLKLIQTQDLTSKLGQRAIELSKHPKLLEGFQLNKYTTFDSMVRSTLTWSIDTENRSAKVDIPALVRDINFFPNNRHSKFRIVISLGIVPDFTFNPATGKFAPPKWYDAMYGCDYVESDWCSALKGSPATTLELSLDQLPPEAGYSLMLGIGIAFGDSLDNGEVKQIKRAGAAKILGIVAGKAFEQVGDHEDETEDVVSDDLPEDVKDNLPEPLHAMRHEAPPSQAPTLSGKASRSKTVRKRAPAEIVQSTVYHYTVSSTAHYSMPVAEATYSYAIAVGAGHAWQHPDSSGVSVLLPGR
jgi:hypothetical protein